MGSRVTVDSTGRAAYALSSLTMGEHLIEAWRYEKRDGTWVLTDKAAPVRVRFELRVDHA